MSKYGHRAQKLRGQARFVHVSEQVFLEVLAMPRVSSRQGALPLRPESFKTFLATGEERPGWTRNTVAISRVISTVKQQHTHRDKEVLKRDRVGSEADLVFPLSCWDDESVMRSGG